MATVDSDSDLFSHFAVLPEKLRKELRVWFENSNSLSIFITGKSGSGKSTLINALVGREVAKQGHTLDPQTTKVSSYETKVKGVKVTVWDSPGLQDGTTQEDEYLADMKEKCKDVDLCIYCISAEERRLTKDSIDIDCMKKLTRVFGTEMWKHTLFVLSFANALRNLDGRLVKAEDAQKPAIFKEVLNTWERELKVLLEKEVGVSKEITEKIQVVPAGHPRNQRLLDRDHWLSPVWFGALYSMKPQAQPAMMKINYHRIVDNPDEVREEDCEKFIHEHPIIFSKRGAEIGERYGESNFGEVVGFDEGISLSVLCKLSIDLQRLLDELARKIHKPILLVIGVRSREESDGDEDTKFSEEKVETKM